VSRALSSENATVTWSLRGARGGVDVTVVVVTGVVVVVVVVVVVAVSEVGGPPLLAPDRSS
jgi:hypothetical protein